MKRKSDSTCYKDFGYSVLPRLYFPLLLSIAYPVLLLLILFSASPAYAEETKVFTDADLVKYNAGPMVDRETLSRMDDDLKSYQKKKEEEVILEKEKEKRKKAEEAKRAALEKKRQAAAASKQADSNSTSSTSTKKRT